MSAKKKSRDFSDLDLRKLDLTRKYDEDFMPADGIAFGEHLLLYLITGCIGVLLTWSSIARLDEVSRGEAKIIPASEVQIIQSLEGGIIDEISVHEGDEVKAGQVLLHMRNVQAGADFAATNQKYLSLLGTVSRLRAEAADEDVLTLPIEVVDGAPDIAETQQQAFAASKKNNVGQVGVLKEQLAQKRQEITELKRRIADSENVLTLSRNEHDMVAPMVEKGSSSKRDLLQIEKQIAQQSTELNGLKLSLPRAQAAAQEIQERINELSSGVAATAQKELVDKEAELNSVKQALKAYKDKSERNDLRSPVHGTVKDIKIRTVGGVAKPSEPIMEIVPLDDQLLVEGHIKPSDIAFIHPGQKAVVRITAFDSSIYGTIDGVVSDISADSMTTDKGESFYRVRVKTDKTNLKHDGKDYQIIPGMQATIDIVTGEKTVLKYLLKPFVKAAQTAMRER